MIKPPGLLDTHHVAELFGCSVKTVRELIRAKKLQAFRVGKRQYGISRAAALEYLENCRVDPEKFYE